MKAKFKELISFCKGEGNESHHLKWMISQTKPFIGSLLLIFVLNLIITVTGIGSTVITKYIIDGATGSGTQFTTIGMVILVSLTLVSIAVGAASGVLSTYINEKYAFGIRSQVYNNVLRGIWKKVSSFHTGDIVTRITSDINSVANGISSILPNFLYLFIRIIIAFFVLYYYDHFLALMALILGPVGILLSLFFSKKLKHYQIEMNRTESEYRSFLQETIENVSILKSFEQESTCVQELTKMRNKRLKIVIRRNHVKAIMSICIQVVFSLGYLVAFGWGIHRLSNNSITYGTMTVFLSLVSQVQVPIMNLGNLIPQFISVLASTGRILEIDTFEAETHTKPIITGDSDTIGFRLDALSFGYDKEHVLKDINLDIKPNQIVGIVGYSGSGKTTLIRLLLSLTQPDQGTITFYDANGEQEAASAAARRFISYVPQGNTLLSGTVRDNLSFGNPDADEQAMWHALHIANADEFILDLDEKLDARIGENGAGFSEGQAQRIAIARAVIKAAPVLILDEATSALDAQTEETVIQRLCENNLLHTCIIITHRRSMLAYCTRALEITDNYITEILDFKGNNEPLKKQIHSC